MASLKGERIELEAQLLQDSNLDKTSLGLLRNKKTATSKTRIMKRVRFSNDEPEIFTYSHESDIDSSICDSQRNVVRREYLERQLLSDPNTELARLQALFDSCQKFDVTIVFGNLGRQPHLLTFYLDFCFPASTNVAVLYPKSFKGLDDTYQDTTEPLDVLFLVEPEFGYTVVKPKHVRNLIVLTSHLILNTPGYSEQVKLLHLGSTILYEGLGNGLKPWKPPLYASEEPTTSRGQVYLDISSCKSVHEAYLRLLTGRQMLRYRQLPVIAPQHLLTTLKFFIQQSKSRVGKYFDQAYLDTWYFDILQEGEPNPFEIILRRNPLKF